MVSLKFGQLSKLCVEIESALRGAQLQDIVLTKNHLILQHYMKGSVLLGLHLNSQVPTLGLLYEELKKNKNLIKPIVLFLKAHAKNKKLDSISLNQEEGRIVYLNYIGKGESGEETCQIKFVLIPRALNVIIKSGSKSISMFPQKTFPPSIMSENPDDVLQFNVQDYLTEWTSVFHNPIKSVMESEEILLQRKLKVIDKKKSALKYLIEDLEKANVPWLNIGEYLKEKQTIDVPDDWKIYIDETKSFSDNLQNCFEKHKEQDRRINHLREKIKHLKEELLNLEDEEILKFSKIKSHQEASRPSDLSVAAQFMQKAGAHGRKFSLNSKVEAVIGKSAADNLSLLRKAQAWDIWVHLKDYPSAHAIIRRPRGIAISHSDILKVAEWVLRQTLKDKNINEGDRYQIVSTECRHVKPIKGDKIGRVIYHNEENLVLKVTI